MVTTAGCEGRDLARDDGLQRGHDVGRGHHRIGRAMRLAAVAAAPVDHDRSRSTAAISGPAFTPSVPTGSSFQRWMPRTTSTPSSPPSAHHGLAPRLALLGGLEEDAHAARQRPARPATRAAAAPMATWPSWPQACMHSRHPRGVGRVALLLDGQAVHVHAQEHRASASAAGLGERRRCPRLRCGRRGRRLAGSRRPAPRCASPRRRAPDAGAGRGARATIASGRGPGTSGERVGMPELTIARRRQRSALMTTRLRPARSFAKPRWWARRGLRRDIVHSTAGQESTGSRPGSRPPTCTLPVRGRGPLERPLSLFRGQVVVVNFWATWCPSASAEMPALDRLHRSLSRDGLVVLGRLRGRRRGGARGLHAGRGGLTLRGPRATRRRGGARGLRHVEYPETFVIDAAGTRGRDLRRARGLATRRMPRTLPGAAGDRLGADPPLLLASRQGFHLAHEVEAPRHHHEPRRARQPPGQGQGALATVGLERAPRAADAPARAAISRRESRPGRSGGAVSTTLGGQGEERPARSPPTVLVGHRAEEQDEGPAGREVLREGARARRVVGAVEKQRRPPRIRSQPSRPARRARRPAPIGARSTANAGAPRFLEQPDGDEQVVALVAARERRAGRGRSAAGVATSSTPAGSSGRAAPRRASTSEPPHRASARARRDGGARLAGAGPRTVARPARSTPAFSRAIAASGRPR